MEENDKKEDINSFIKNIVKNQTLRREVTTKSHLWFFYVYLSHHVRYEIAPFQKEMFLISENTSNFLSVIVAFRGSAKSTIMTLSYPLWAILGEQKKKCVVIISQTQEQARIHFKNLKIELEENKLLKSDLGPFRDESEWNLNTLMLPKYNAKITAVSSEQSIRGIKHGPHRPDLIICDDVEDSNSVKTKEGRDKTYDWFTREIVPLGDKNNTRIIVVGNLLHEDSLIKRLASEIEEDKRNGIYKEYPIKDDNNNILWPGKYPDMDAIETEKKNTGDLISWLREYELKIVSNTSRVILPEWIQYYEMLPTEDYEYTAIAVDLAISQKDSADFTAILLAKVFGYNDNLRIYILPNPINEHLSFLETTEKIKLLANNAGGRLSTKIFVEDIGYQPAVIETLRESSFDVESFKVGRADKRSRLHVASLSVQAGKVLFPQQGAEELINQITNFELEKHDDLADAFSILVIKAIEHDSHRCRAWANKPEGW